MALLHLPDGVSRELAVNLISNWKIPALTDSIQHQKRRQRFRALKITYSMRRRSPLSLCLLSLAWCFGIRMGLLIGWGQEDRNPLESRLGICRLSVALVQLLLSATDKTVWHALIDKQGKRLVENYAKGGGGFSTRRSIHLQRQSIQWALSICVSHIVRCDLKPYFVFNQLLSYYRCWSLC